MSQSVEALESRSATSAPPIGQPVRMKPMLGGASLVIGGSLIWQLSNFAFNAVGAHALGPARYGVLAASTALLGFATPFLAALQAVASREATSLMARKELRKVRPMLRHYGLRVALGSLLLGGAVAAASKWISDLFHLGSPWFVVVVGAVIPCYTVSHLLGGLLQGIERFARFALESIVEGLTKAIIGTLTMGLLWRSALAGMVAVAASCAAGFVTYLVITLPVLNRIAISVISGKFSNSTVARGRSAHRRKPRRGVSGVVRYSFTALMTYGLLALMLSSDTLIAKHYLSNHQAGLYAGVSLAGKIAYFAASSLFVVTFPVFARQHDQGTSSGKSILAVGGIVFATTGMIVSLFKFEPAWVVVPLLGARYRVTDGYVPWMAAIFGLYALGFLLSSYLLARKRRSVIAVLVVALVVQYGGFFSFHSTIPDMMGVLAVAFGVMLLGGLLLVLLSRGRPAGTPPLGNTPTGPRHAGEHASKRAPGLGGGMNRPVPQPRGSWQEQIVTEVSRRVGFQPVLLAGSRAIGTAHEGSDYDVSVVLPVLRIPRAAPRLAGASRQLSAALGAHVSVNPVPGFRLRRPGGSLFVRKLQAEAIVLAAPPGWSLSRQPLTNVTEFAASSVLLSAVQSLLRTFDPSAMRGNLNYSQANDSLRKAALHVAQVKLLRSGCYESELERALARLNGTAANLIGRVSGSELSATLTASITAGDPLKGFLCLRQCILSQLAEISDMPLSLPITKSLVRNAQYAVLAKLRGRNRWRVALRRSSVESALAATLLALLRALNPDAPDGLDAVHFHLASEACPVPLGPVFRRNWEGVRDLALAEWPDAHPLVGVLA